MSTEPVLHPHSAPRPANRRLASSASRRVHARPARRMIDRPRLLAALAERPGALALLVAPAGWGKSTLLAQWRAADPRPFATILLGPGHDDAGVLATAIEAALEELRASAKRAVLVLDGFEALRSAESRALVAHRASELPPGIVLAVASRLEPGLALGRRRAEDDVVELRADQLGMTVAEAGQLLRTTSPDLPARTVERLHALTGGWPAALRLAARALREHGAGAALSGADAAVADYVREEVLATLSTTDRAFLRQAAVIEPLTGAACDVALGTRGSAVRLRRLAAAGLPLGPADRSGTAMLLHPLLAEVLRAELRDLDADAERRLHRRLSRWHEDEGHVVEAIEHAVAGRDLARASDLLASHAASVVAGGRLPRAQEWVGSIAHEQVARHAGLALTAALADLASGRCDAADRWAVVAGSGEGPVHAGALVVRALCAREGVDQMHAHARAALAETPVHGVWRSWGCLAEGWAHLLTDRPDEAVRMLADGARAAVFDAPLTRSLCLAGLALVALDRGDDEEAAAFATRARGALERDGAAEHGLCALGFAVDAAVAVQRGWPDAAREALEIAARCMGTLPDPPAWYAALTFAVGARVALRLGDADRGREMLARASRSHRQVPGAPALQRWIEDGWAVADDFAAGPATAGGPLTMAELRVLRLLPSHLSLPEIAARLRVSPNTVKSQAHAVYRKLGVRSRSEAVASAAAIGLVDARLSRAG